MFSVVLKNSEDRFKKENGTNIFTVHRSNIRDGTSKLGLVSDRESRVAVNFFLSEF